MESLASTSHEKECKKTMIKPSYKQALLSTPGKWLPKTMIKPSYKQALLSTPGKWLPTDDGIVVISERSKDMEGEVTVKEKLDEYMDRALYGSKESSLPVFRRLCRE